MLDAFDFSDAKLPSLNLTNSTKVLASESIQSEASTPRHLLNVPESQRSDSLFHSDDYISLFDQNRFSGADVEKIMIMIANHGGAADVIIASDMKMIKKKDRIITPIFPRQLVGGEVRDFVEFMFGIDTYHEAINPETEDIDTTYTITYESDNQRVRLRYRVNICAFQSPNMNQGLKITLRNLPTKIPTFDSLNVPQIIRDNCMPREGLVIIAGETGSGKTTLCSSILEAINRDALNFRITLTYEQPPEYLLSELPGPNPIFQHSVGKFANFFSFAAGLRNALRCTPETIFVGECRDRETFEILPRVAESGHMGLATTHAKSIPNIFSRVANEIDSSDSERIIRMFINYSHLLVVQFLAPKIGGGVIPVQEILLLTPAIKKTLLQKPVGTDFIHEIESSVEIHGQTMKAHATELHQNGKIALETFHFITSGV
jgi:defect in organelle trafficking protein DotB